MQAARLIDKWIGYASGVLAFVGAIAIVLMMMHVVVDVTGRYVFNHPFPATIESVTYYYMVMVTALPFAYVTRSQGQITVEMFTELAAAALASALIDAFVGLLMLIYVVVMAWKIGQEAVNKTILGEVHDAGTIAARHLAVAMVARARVRRHGIAPCALRMFEDLRGFLRP